ncbi:MAG TPA: YtxH domain-containing protein [Verrucomicrobiae bacterium]|nr:YtxH domain-containing protein [Verrucomicrobiae bacterium]
MTENNSYPVGGFLAVFAIGALAGAGIALLYAPRSGEETRNLIAAKGRELKGKATDALGDARDYIDGKKAEIAAAVEAGKEAMHEERAKHQKHA